MIEQPLIKIKTLYLTDDNTLGGNRYIATVKGLERLDTSQTGATRQRADGSPVVQLAALKGAQISISFPLLRRADAEAVAAIFEQFIADGLPFSLDIEAGGKTYSAQVVPDFPNAFVAGGDFLNGRIRDAQINLRTV